MRRFNELRPLILDFISDPNNLDNIKSLEINRRKPHTKRLFFHLGEERVCLHDFEPCDETDSFPHPHSWESEIMILDGSYIHATADDVRLDENISSSFDSICEKTTLVPGDSYHMDSPHSWHKVTPITKVSTIMINGPIWDVHSDFCKFTKGKELKEVSVEEKQKMVNRFIKYLGNG